jgi:hypothetical protein
MTVSEMKGLLCDLCSFLRKIEDPVRGGQQLYTHEQDRSYFLSLKLAPPPPPPTRQLKHLLCIIGKQGQGGGTKSSSKY